MFPVWGLNAYYNDNCFHYNNIVTLSVNLSVKKSASFNAIILFKIEYLRKNVPFIDEELDKSFA